MSDSFRLATAKLMGEVHNLLCDKNEQYGDSALNPIRMFSKADGEAGIEFVLMINYHGSRVVTTN